ncbi:hypothetical protein B296_00054015 [Ensete ventricosum]|uniref:Uncharacterized protein n=1 Tax=Ensete ventricosum TaxID=4639 RepID=A0A426WWG2_ENSVE|nr:hypothetical protein B296_00054015 [Ensete ventricosum]
MEHRNFLFSMERICPYEAEVCNKFSTLLDLKGCSGDCIGKESQSSKCICGAEQDTNYSARWNSPKSPKLPVGRMQRGELLQQDRYPGGIGPESLSTGQEDVEAGTLEEYAIVLLFELYEGNGAQRRLCWWGKEAQDPDNGAPILAESGDFESYQATDCPTEILCPGVTREWVGEGELPKERTQSEVVEALRCAGRGHTWRDRSPSSSHKNLNAMEMSPGGDMVQRIVME